MRAYRPVEPHDPPTAVRARFQRARSHPPSNEVLTIMTLGGVTAAPAATLVHAPQTDHLRDDRSACTARGR